MWGWSGQRQIRRVGIFWVKTMKVKENLNTEASEVWIRGDLRDKNVVSVLRSTPYNPFNIPLAQLLECISEDAGTVEFTIAETGNLFNTNLDRVVILDLPVGCSRFILERQEKFFIVYYHLSEKIGLRMAKLDVREMASARSLYLCFTWSSSESVLYVGDFRGDPKNAKAETMPTRVVKGKDGSFVLIGDEGVNVGIVYIRKGEELIVEPNAKELFDFNIERINTLISRLPSGDFLFENSAVQAGISMLVSAFEAYFKKRFVEMEKEGWKPDLDALFSAKIFRQDEDFRKRVEDLTLKEGKSAIEELSSGFDGWWGINFQNFDSCKRAFNKCYGIKFGEIPDISSQLIDKVRKFIDFRHEIIHSGRDTTILNYKDIPQKEPVFANKGRLREAADAFSEFVSKINKVTIKTAT